MPAISGRIYAGDFGSEDMPAISGQKICRRFRVEKKNAGKVGSEQNVSKFGPEKNAGVFGRG